MTQPRRLRLGARSGQSGEARIFLIQDDNLTAEVPLRRSILQSTLRQKYRSTGRHNPQRDGGPEKGLYRLHPIALGMEAAVLRGLSLREVRPWIILVEATVARTQIPNHHDWDPLLTGRGYRFVHFDGLNRFYVAEEKAELIPRVEIPPNIFDDWFRAHDWVAREQAATLSRQIAVERASLQAESASLQAEREVLLAEAEARNAEIAIRAREAEIRSAEAEARVEEAGARTAETAARTAETAARTDEAAARTNEAAARTD